VVKEHVVVAGKYDNSQPAMLVIHDAKPAGFDLRMKTPGNTQSVMASFAELLRNWRSEMERLEFAVSH